MPSNLLDELAQSLDPMDAATMFAGLRNTVPLSMLFRSGDLNAGEAEELAKRRGPATMPAAPTVDPAESNRRAQMDFEMQYPDPRIREMLIAEMLKEARNPYSATTATRRRDFEEAPIRADQFMSAAPKKTKKFANGGAIDFTVPDMADGGRFIPDAQPYAKGGSAAKTLDQMAAEMLQKGVKLESPARRGFLGLGKGTDFPLAKMDTEALERMQSDLKGAPAITEKSVTVDPGKGAAKSTLKSVSETPMTRREVLQSAAGQAMRGVLPDLGGIGNVAKIAESVAAPAVLSADVVIPGLVAKALKMGLSEEDAMQYIAANLPKGVRGAENLDVGTMHYLMQSPFEYASNPEFAGASRLGMIRDVLQQPSGASPYNMRGALRNVMRENPEAYRDLKDVATDIRQYGHEN